MAMLLPLLPATMMLEHLGYAAEAERISVVLQQALADTKQVTPDLGGTASALM